LGFEFAVPFTGFIDEKRYFKKVVLILIREETLY